MRTLQKLIKDNEVWIRTNCVCFCDIDDRKCNIVKITDLTPIQLNTKYKESEWWLEDGDLCICKDK